MNDANKALDTRNEDLAQALADRVVNILDDREQAAQADDYEQWHARSEAYESAEIDKLRAEKERLRSELTDLAAQRANHPELGHIVDMLEGRITHVVTFDHGWQIALHTFDDYLNATDRKDFERSIVLSPRKANRRQQHPYTLIIRGAAYHDGSGNTEKVTLCRSEAEAEAAVRQLFARSLALWRGEAERNRGERRPDSSSSMWKQFADTGVDLAWPADLLAAINNAITDQATKALAEATEKLRKAEAAAAKPQLFNPGETTE